MGMQPEHPGGRLHLVSEHAPPAHDRNGLEVLSEAECFRLLASKSLGRVGLTVGALPTVLPVNFRLIGEHIYFRTSAGPKLEAATSCAVVAFEVDDIDPISHDGWSVVVTGVARPVENAEEISRLDAIGIPLWTPAPQTRVVAISADVVTGRRLNHRMISLPD